jgi:tRNA(Leu) C34 or U34 (ribose-2'-O)-methylase TrmL
MDRLVIGKHAPPAGQAPAIVLLNPKYSHNVAAVLRTASCYGVRQVWFTGDRVRLDMEARKRIPREERMRGYAEVDLYCFERPLEQFPRGCVPIAVEVRAESEPLTHFVHPENAVYIFGPEDGSIHQTILSLCHRFVRIPTRHCLNLATAAATVLYDRCAKLDKFPAPSTSDELVTGERELATQLGLCEARAVG